MSRAVLFPVLILGAAAVSMGARAEDWDHAFVLAFLPLSAAVVCAFLGAD